MFPSPVALSPPEDFSARPHVRVPHAQERHPCGAGVLWPLHILRGVRTWTQVGLTPRSSMFASLSILLLLALLGPASSASIGPTVQRCPVDFQLVRRGQTISESEARYIQQKRGKVLPGAFKTYLESVKGTGVQLPPYVERILESQSGVQLPTVGISVSGGGYFSRLLWCRGSQCFGRA